MERIQGGSHDGIDTHKTTYFQKIWRSLPVLVNQPLELVCDPFARNCSIAHPHTNDVDPTTTAENHMDAVDYLKTESSSFFDLVIFDPPFSRRMEMKYEGTQNVYSTPGYVPKLMTEIYRILAPGGYLLKFGFNTTRHKLGFEWISGWVVNIGGNRNDVLVSLWRKVNTSLEDF